MLERSPPGRAVKPLPLSAEILGVCQCNIPDSLSFPPAITSPPKLVVSVDHSSSVGICQPEGHTFLPPFVAVFMANQL